MTHALRLLLVAPLAAALVAGCGDNTSIPGDPDAAIDPPPADAPPEPPPPSLRVLDFLIAVDVTPDGRTAVFEEITTDEVTAMLVDTVTGTVVPGGVVGDPSRNLATAISATGRITALHGEPVQAAIWTMGDGWLDLGSPHAAGCGADEISGAFDISADGHVVVGLAWDGCTPDAFRWSDASGAPAFTSLERLGAPAPGSPNPPTNRATVVSDDGAVIAGFAQNGPIDRSPAVWAADGSGVMLDPDEMDIPGEVLSISGDGALVAGIQGDDGFVWTTADGFTILPRLDISLPTDRVYPNAIADGGLVFGAIGDAFFSIPIAFVWREDTGTRALGDVAAAAGVELPAGMILNNVLGVSRDGTVLIGTAMDAEFNPKTFVLRVPAGAFEVR